MARRIHAKTRLATASAFSRLPRSRRSQRPSRRRCRAPSRPPGRPVAPPARRRCAPSGPDTETRRDDIAGLVEDRRGDAAQPDRVLLVVDRVASARARSRSALSSAGVVMVLTRQPRHAALHAGLRPASSRTPPTASPCPPPSNAAAPASPAARRPASSGGIPPGRGRPSRPGPRSPRFTVSPLSSIRRACSPGQPDQAARLGERAAHGESLHADRPQPAVVVEAHVAFLFQRGQQPVRRRGRQAHLLGEVGQGGPAVGRFRDAVEQAERPHQRLHLVASRAPAGCARRRLPPCFAVVACRAMRCLSAGVGRITQPLTK